MQWSYFSKVAREIWINNYKGAIKKREQKLTQWYTNSFSNEWLMQKDCVCSIHCQRMKKALSPMSLLVWSVEMFSWLSQLIWISLHSFIFVGYKNRIWRWCQWTARLGLFILIMVIWDFQCKMRAFLNTTIQVSVFSLVFSF